MGSRVRSLMPLVLVLVLVLMHPVRKLLSRWWWRERQEVSVAVIAVPHVARSHIGRGGVRLGVLRDTEAACGHKGDVQVRTARRSRIWGIVGEPDFALFTGYGLKTKASMVPRGRE